MSIHPVVSCSQSDQDDLVCSVQVVVAIFGVEVRVHLMPVSCCERLDDGFLILVGDRLVRLIKVTYLFCLAKQLTSFRGHHNMRESTGG